MAANSRADKHDFSQGPVWRNIVSQAVPLTIAQFVHLLYNVVDRIYIGHMEGGGSLALTGIGLTFPVVTVILAFTALFGPGGVPLFSIARGAGRRDEAERIMGNSMALLLISAVILTVFGYLFCRPILFAFGASEASYVYAGAYLKVYLVGTIFSMAATGMNGYINAQGFPGIGMLSIVIGAGLNIILDPIFIFVLGKGVAGAAAASVISQAVSAVWVVRFLCSNKAIVPLTLKSLSVKKETAAAIARLGTSNFIMQGTNFLVQIACNVTLQNYGGDLYVGLMTIANSVRDIFMLPMSGLVSGSQPVISYNYGAKEYKRVTSGVRFNTIAGASYMMAAWLLVILLPRLFIGLFSNDPATLEAGASLLRLYFFGFVFMALQFAAQSTFQAIGDARHAIFFSLLRKAFVVVPLTLLLPAAGFGVRGVFLAEPVSNVIGGLASYLTMLHVLPKRLADREA